jgi:hypothetical protein
MLLALVLLSACSSGCGGSGSRTAVVPRSSSTIASPAMRDGDKDIDMLTRSPYDDDGDAIPAFGPSAPAADRRAIVALIGRYYALAAMGNGGRACSMLDVPATETLVEGHHRGRGTRALQGDTCAQIMSRLFEQRHHELEEDIKGYKVLAVQERRNIGYALVRFPARRELREMQVLARRVHGVWMMDVPLDNGAQ